MAGEVGSIKVDPQAAGVAADGLAASALALREAHSTYLPRIQAALEQACAAGGDDVAQFQQQAGPALQQLTDGTSKVESLCDSLSAHCEASVVVFQRNDDSSARGLLA